MYSNEKITAQRGKTENDDQCEVFRNVGQCRMIEEEGHGEYNRKACSHVRQTSMRVGKQTIVFLHE